MDIDILTKIKKDSEFEIKRRAINEPEKYGFFEIGGRTAEILKENIKIKKKWIRKNRKDIKVDSQCFFVKDGSYGYFALLGYRKIDIIDSLEKLKTKFDNQEVPYNDRYAFIAGRKFHINPPNTKCKCGYEHKTIQLK